MKKTLLAIMALGMTMTSCMNDEFPNAARYGYINLNVSNDPIVETRATVTNLSEWTVVVTKGTETKFAGKADKLVEQSFTSGTDYSLTVYNCTEEESVASYGKGRWEGRTESNFTVSQGDATPITINCGTAKNAKVGATFNLTDNFSNFNIVLDPTERNLTIENATTYAFFPAGELSFNFTYDYTNPSGVTTTGKNIDGTINCVAGKLHLINIQSDNSGTITLTINYDDFTQGDGVNLQFNAATGEKI